MSRFMLAAMVLFGVAFSRPSEARKSDTEGVPIEITVLDEEGKALPTAVVRHPDEADRRRVNSVNGKWSGSRLYLPDGSELIFTPGMTVQFEISAPGYMTQIIQYDIRKRKNNIEVALDKLNLEDETGIEEPVIQFGRDKPRDEGGVGPAN